MTRFLSLEGNQSLLAMLAISDFRLLSVASSTCEKELDTYTTPDFSGREDYLDLPVCLTGKP